MYSDIKIVSVDDNYINLLLIEALAKELSMNVKSFTTAKESYEYILRNDVDILLTDYMMPEVHGIELISSIRSIYSDLLIVMITAIVDDNSIKLEALKAGATDFLNKPLNPAEFKARLMNLANLRRAQLLLKDRARLLEEEVRKSVKVIEEREHETLSVLGRAAEYKDLATAAHINRVSAYSTIILRETGVKLDDLATMFFAAPLHDVGKMGIPDDILLKPGPYNGDEFAIMKKHPIIGYEMLKDVKSPYLQQGALISLGHHEKFNGTGYPQGLKGEEIPINARIVAIADVFDALTTVRPYKKVWTIDSAVEFMVSERGNHFDPSLLDIFLEKIDLIIRVYNNQTDKPLTFNDFMENF